MDLKPREPDFSNGAMTIPKICPHCQTPLEPESNDAPVAGNPLVTPNPPPAAAAASSLETSAGPFGSRTVVRERSLRGYRTPLTALACLCLLVLVLLAMLFPPGIWRGRPAERSGNAAAHIAGANAAAPTAAASAAVPADDPAAATGIRLPDGVQHGVVLLESLEPGPRSLGSGFVVDPAGLVATNYHVVSHATRVRAVFSDGAACDVEGYAAVDIDQDLAILQLRTLPLRATALPIADELPEPLAPVVAIGHPQGVTFSLYDGRISRMVRTDELPTRLRYFALEAFGGQSEAVWIQHTATLSEGNSGGPLLGPDGNVIGVNTWFDRQSGFGYAVDARRAAALLQRRLPEVAPLVQFARTPTRVAATLRSLRAEEVDRLYAEASAIGWQPRSDAQYRILQDLAWAVTFANLPATGDTPEAKEQRELLIRAADRAVAQLAAAEWNEPGQLTIINEYAARHLADPAAGLFFFATVLRLVEGPEGQQGMLVRLAGSERTALIRLDGLLFRPEPATQLLVLGVNDRGQVVRYGENPLHLETAPVVVSRTLLKLE